MTKNRFDKKRIRLKKGEYQRSNGTFEFRWMEKIDAHHSVRRYVYAKSLPELRKKEEEIQKDIIDGIKTKKRDMTINDFFETWKKIKSGVRESSFDTYLRIYKRYIEPDFGNTPLQELSYSTIVIFYKSLIESKGVGISTVDNLNVVLTMILDVAVRDGVLRANPCHGTLKELQRKYADTVKEVRALTDAEQTMLEEFLSRPGLFHCLCPLITVMLYTGMRVGEIGALRWADVDFNKNVINIAHTLIFNGKANGDRKEYVLNPPKTKKSERRIPMNSIVRSALIAEKQRQIEDGITCNIVIDGCSDFVFLDNKGGVFHYKKLNHRLDRISQALDCEIKAKGIVNGLTSFPHIHSHMLRHTFATRMREAGADIKATADIMGHTEVDLTLNTYTDATEEFKKKEISLLAPDKSILAAEVTSLPQNLPQITTKIREVEGS